MSHISNIEQASLQAITAAWGVEILRVELQNVKIVKRPPPPAHNFLKTLMQPQLASAIWDTLLSGKMSVLPVSPGKSGDTSDTSDPEPLIGLEDVVVNGVGEEMQQLNGGHESRSLYS